MSARITVVGIGEDGLDGLTPKARGLIDAAELVTRFDDLTPYPSRPILTATTYPIGVLGNDDQVIAVQG